MITPAVPIWLDLMCVGVGAFQGALFAIFYKRFDLVGVISVAIISGLGGGMLRDLLLAAGRPSGLQDQYILTAIAGAIAALILGRWYRKAREIIALLDSIAIAFFAIAGTYKALLFDASPLVAVLLGVITGVGGGVLRDVVCRVTPQIFSGGPLYATATAIGSALFIALESTDLDLNIAVAITAITIVTIHMISIRFQIHLRPLAGSADQDFEEPNQGR